MWKESTMKLSAIHGSRKTFSRIMGHSVLSIPISPMVWRVTHLPGCRLYPTVSTCLNIRNGEDGVDVTNYTSLNLQTPNQAYLTFHPKPKLALSGPMPATHLHLTFKTNL